MRLRRVLTLIAAMGSKLPLRIGLVGLFMVVHQICTADEKGTAAAGSRFLDWFDSGYLQAGVGTHWDDDDEYEGVAILGGLEVAHEDRHRFGVSLFNNSYNQFCQYYYYGYKWRLPFISESAHLKITGGLIYGYVDETEDKLALSADGWAPVIIPSLGWKRDRLGFDIAVLGDAGLMFLVGYDIWRR